jgi:hypothetical protein
MRSKDGRRKEGAGMIKYFCDRCGKECSKPAEIKVPHQRGCAGNFSTRGLQVCADCNKEHNDLLNKLVDIRFIMYRDFIKGGGKMKKYNTLVRQAISDKYEECSKTMSMLIKERQLTISRLELEKETLPYNEYIRLQKKSETMAKEIEELSIQLNVWEMAREICLNVADDHPTGKGGEEEC